MAAKTVTDSTFDVTVSASILPVLVDFWAPWCGPCRQLGPVIDALADEHGDRLTVVKCNTDENPVTAARFGVTSLPTLLVLLQGEVVKQVAGAQGKPRLLRELAEWLG